MFGATVGERILTTELDWADRSFDGVVVEFDAAIIDEARQALPTRECGGLGEPDFLADQSKLGAQRPKAGSSAVARGGALPGCGRGFPFRSRRWRQCASVPRLRSERDQLPRVRRSCAAYAP